jgi:hypothetical protein
MKLKMFDIMKTPDWWCMQAYIARKAAERLWSGHHESRSEEEEEFYVVMGSTMYTPALLFAGVELELYLKAITISAIDLNREEIEWKSKIFGPSHDLVKLCSIAAVELSEKERETCRGLSKYIRWTGRYPIPKSEIEFRMRSMEKQQDLWSRYLEIRDRFRDEADKCCRECQERLMDHYAFKRGARHRQKSQ